MFLFLLLASSGLALAATVAYYFWKLDSDLVLWALSKLGRPKEDLHGKVIWIIGASSGIGAELAVDLAMAGTKLVLSATRVANLEDIRKRCLKVNGRLKDSDILVLPLDISDTSSHRTHLDAVVKHFGKLDILVNNAARFHVGRFEETDLEIDRKDFEINVFGLINLTRTVTNYWLKAGLKGHLVVTSSCGGFQPIPGSSTYSATKYALHGYFDSARVELFHRNIKVTVVCPGPVDTELLNHSFATKVGETLEKRPKPPMVMSAERCAELYSVAIANEVDECWILPNPYLAAIYAAVNFPTLSKYFMKRIINAKRFGRMLKGQM
jgi:dehydrogenase/reductase SDR family protein 7